MRLGLGLVLMLILVSHVHAQVPGEPSNGEYQQVILRVLDQEIETHEERLATAEQRLEEFQNGIPAEGERTEEERVRLTQLQRDFSILQARQEALVRRREEIVGATSEDID